MQRRDLLKTMAAFPVVMVAPAWLHRLWAADSLTRPGDRGLTSHILVLVELHGGNDGLNTLIPFGDSAYHALRPKLAIPREQIKQLTPQLGLHPALEPLRPLWENDLAIVAGVGYPRPNRSHFRSIEIWETGSGSEQVLDDGWLARLFHHHPLPSNFTADGVLLGKGDEGPLAGSRSGTITLRDPNEFLREAEMVRPVQSVRTNRALSHILDVQRDISHAAGDLQTRLQQGPTFESTFPTTKLGRQLEMAARLLAVHTPVAVMKVTHGSFDTHAGQLPTHHRLLEELAQALTAFRTTMVKQGLWDRILVATYSEFGRRVAENGSSGTDHGTAAPHFLLGGQVRGGLYGTQPLLTSLQDGDLKHSVDYRCLYNTIIRGWWDLRSDLFSAQEFPPLDCLKT